MIIDCRPDILWIFNVNKTISKKLVYKNPRLLLKWITCKDANLV